MSTIDRRSLGFTDRRLEFETLIVDLSTRFVNLPPGEVDHEIEDALRHTCEVLRIDFASIWQRPLAAGAGPAVPTHIHHPAGGVGPVEGIHVGLFPWYREQLSAGRTIAIRSLDELPVEAAVDLATCRRMGVKSNLTFPLAAGGEPVGAISFNATNAERDWPDGLVRRLKLVAQTFTNAIVRKRHDLNRKANEERLSLAADAAGAGLWMLDHRTGAFSNTERAREIFGFSSDETVDLDRFETSIHPGDRALVLGAIARSMRNGEAIDLEYRTVPSRASAARWLALRGRPRLNAAGECSGLAGAAIDITDRKLREEALRSSEARLQSGADLAGLAYYEVDFGRGELFVDDRFRALLGLPPGVEGGPEAMEFWIEHVHPEDRPRVMELRRQLVDGMMDRTLFEYRFLHPTKGETWIQHLSQVTTRVSNGNVNLLFGVMRDITERRRREVALQESNAEILRLKDRLQAESDYLKAEIGTIRPGGVVTGDSAGIRKVLQMVDRVAPTDSSVIIFGETGTGKELVAQALHRQSPRRSHLMVSLNCAALPAGLVESEMFGRERGAFTGALTRQIGRFELADRSTLFLDEIGELSLEVQAKLLRVLESGEFERLGNPRTFKVDVRVIAATNRDLLEEVRKGRFREDLYYRLNVFPIRVPPLRERSEDIPLLVWTFLEELAPRVGKKITQISRKTMDTLQRHRWPGNVRELKNVIEHAAILTNGETLKVGLLGSGATIDGPPPRLADSERELILRALESAGWRIKGSRGAALSLGLNPSTLYSRMKKLGIQARGKS